MKEPVLLILIILVLAYDVGFAQTSAFTYQGKLASSGTPANGDHQFEFKLFDAATGITQIGTTQTMTATVQDGSFSTRLDFGATAFVAGQDRWLEISVRLNGSSDPFTVLNPRQQVNSVPFAVRSLQATNADNAASLAGVTAGNYVQTSDTRLSDARTPTAGSTDYIQNIPGQQSASFNITGAGTANTFNAATQYNIGGSRVLSVGADGNNVFAGVLAGQSTNVAGINNSFFGFASGHSNFDGHNNAFFGKTAGFSNSTGRFNAFFGSSSGQSNVSGGNNTAIGALADVGAPDLNFATAIGAGAVVSSSNTIVLGRSTDTVQIPGVLNATGWTTFGGTLGANIFNAEAQYNIGGTRVLKVFSPDSTSISVGILAGTASGPHIGFNSFFGNESGRNWSDGGSNSFFGAGTGINSTGSGNALFGRNAGVGNTTGGNNTLIGSFANVGSGNLSNATAIGAGAMVSQSNSLVLGNGVNVGIGTIAPAFKLEVVDPTNTGLRVQTNTAGGTVASFGHLGAFRIDDGPIDGGRLTVLENGNVGIGTPDPTAKLEVIGNVNITNGHLNTNGFVAPRLGLILTSVTDGTCWILRVYGAGSLYTSPVTCP